MEALVILPRLGIRGNVSFCIDTGADCSLLSPVDVSRLRIDPTTLSVGQDSAGVGGRCKTYSEPATLIFFEPRRHIYFYDIELGIAAAQRNMSDLPSLLGRDVLDRWRLVVNPTSNQVYAKVLSADETDPVPPALADITRRTKYRATRR